jgi:hypothetical protein
MLVKRFLFLGTILALALVMFAFPVFAVTSILRLSFSCNQIQVSYTSDDSMGEDEAIITIINTDTNLIIYQSPPLRFLHDVFGGTYTINFPAQPEGSNLIIDVDAGATDRSKGVCSGLVNGNSAIAFADGRFCFGRGEADIALFPDGDGLLIYRLNEDDTGEKIFEFSGEELSEIVSNPEANILIANTADNFVRFYRLSSGQYQINVGPNEEGKVYVCIFEAIPDTDASVFSYFVTVD